MSATEAEDSKGNDQNRAQNQANLGLYPSPLKLSPQEIKQLSPAALAYVGDAVYELYVRQTYLLPPKRQQAYHKQVVAQVRAETQARHLQSLQAYLTETELDIIRRGRNAAIGRPKRVTLAIYQQATGLEALIGYLYLSDRSRLNELLAQLDLEI